MSTFVKLTIVATVVVFGILAAGIYHFYMTKGDISMVMEEGGAMQYDEATAKKHADAVANDALSPPEFPVSSEVEPVANASEVMHKLFSLNTANPFEVKLPEGNKSVVLTHFIKVKQTEVAIGDYQDGEVKGRVLLDYMRITPLNFNAALDPNTQSSPPIQNDSTMQNIPFVVPFIVTTQGSGAFWYLGLFNLDYGHNSLNHFGSVMLGDRIEVDNIEPVYPFEPPYKVTVTYRDRAPNQPMSEEPKVVKTIEMTVSGSEIK